MISKGIHLRCIRYSVVRRHASNILVLNCGSSSIKYKVINVETATTHLRGNLDRLAAKDYDPAVKSILCDIQDSNIEVSAVGHRWVNGGERFRDSVVISPTIEQDLNDLISLAPLHNPHNMRGIQAARAQLPSIPHVAVFDTSFHSTIEEMIYLYPLPLEISKQCGVRKYGFHGTSYGYVCSRLQDILTEAGEQRVRQVLVAHLGAGCSAAAVSVSPKSSSHQAESTGGIICRDTTMGYTPLDGLMMATRCGSIDPSILPNLAELMRDPNSSENGLSSVMDTLNKKSGLLGVSGVTADMRDILSMAQSKPLVGDSQASERQRRCQLALDMFSHRAAREMMALTASLPGPVDCIVFTGGIGEMSGHVREKILGHMKSCGHIQLDASANLSNESIVTNSTSSVQVYVIPTNEELQIAREAYRLCTKEVSG